MLDLATRQLVKATAPVLKTHGVVLTRHFYARMFQHNFAKFEGHVEDHVAAAAPGLSAAAE